MPQCQLPVFCCFWFQKSYTGNILRIGRNENPVSYFLDTYTESKWEKEGSHEAPTPRGGASPSWPRGDMVWGPQGPLDIALSPINTSLMENSKYPIRNPRKVLSPPSSSTLDREGSGALPGTLPEGRSSPEGSTSPCLPPE